MVTPAEIHNLRDADYATAVLMWTKGWNKTIWTMPNAFALERDGKIASGCRALEALRVLHDLDSSMNNLRNTRQRMAQGIVMSERLKQAQIHATLDGQPKLQSRVELRIPDDEPVRAAEYKYVREHGQAGMGLLLARLFDKLLPQ